MTAFDEGWAYAGLAACVFACSATPASAQAQCDVPNVLTNGEVADATEVMDNFNAVAACVESTNDSAVTHQGTPSAGELAVFESSTGITGGDLTGDVSTSGSTVTTLSQTGVVAGTYTNATITVDDKGRLTGANSGAVGGSGSGASKYTVAAAGDNFIDVKLDADDGYVYRVLVKGRPSADTKLFFRVSSDNGQTFHDGSADYKYYDVGSSSVISLSNKKTILTNRVTIVDFTLAGMNVATTEKIALTGTIFTVATGISNVAQVIGGHNNGLPAGDFNAFRIYVPSGNMDDFVVYVEKMF